MTQVHVFCWRPAVDVEGHRKVAVGNERPCSFHCPGSKPREGVLVFHGHSCLMARSMLMLMLMLDVVGMYSVHG